MEFLGVNEGLVTKRQWGLGKIVKEYKSGGQSD